MLAISGEALINIRDAVGQAYREFSTLTDQR
jgi:hypothetical protein